MNVKDTSRMKKKRVNRRDEERAIGKEEARVRKIDE